MIQNSNRITLNISGIFLWLPVVFLILASPTLFAKANDNSNIHQPSLLQPSDTSSPRDTLRSFMSNMNIITRDWEHQEFSQLTAQAFLRAIETLDLSTTPHSNSWGVRSTRVLLMNEILNRVRVPEYNDIPGKHETADGGITQWSIPNTRITLKLIEQGPRAGEFLFSASTVQQLDRFYRHVQHLPDKPGVSPGILVDWNRSVNTKKARYQQARNRLIPVDTSNPRSTLEDFLDSVNRAYALVLSAEAALETEPPSITTAEAIEIEQEAINLLHRATATLDLSQIAKAHREDVGLESILQLKEIFDRMLLPPLDSIPTAQMVAAEREQQVISSSSLPSPIRWQYPNTEIEIVEILAGDKQGQFLFSANTIQHVSKFYEKVHDLPYRKGVESLDYKSPGKSEGFYHNYISTPGYLIQSVHFLGIMVDELPDWFKTIYLGQTIWQWLGIILCTLTVVVLGYLIYQVISHLSKKLNSPWNGWLKILSPLLTAVVIIVIVDFIDDDINITGQVLAIVSTISKAIVYILLGWAAFKVIIAVVETIINLPQIPNEGIDASLLRISARIIGAILGIWVIIHGVHKLGVDIVPLLAGLGIGGLTVALAARPTMANIIGSFMIFADHPYQVGQRVKVMDQDGIVESIGLRSTKIRLLNGHLSAIPNEKMASVEVENIGQRPYIRRVFNLAIPYDTAPDKINQATGILQKILAIPDAVDTKSTFSSHETGNKSQSQRHPNEAINQPNFPPRVYFNDFTDNALNILVIYWYHPPEYWDYLEHANWINIQIMEQFNATDIEFAFPTQTLHLAGDEKRPVSVAEPPETEEKNLTRSALFAQAAAFGAQTVLSNQSSASEAIRPQPGKKSVQTPGKGKELTDAPLEEHFLHGNNANEPDDVEGDEPDQD